MSSPTPTPLHLVATPIGNLGDVSPRVRTVLSETEVLACESKSSAQRLFSALSLPLPRLLLYREDTASHAERELLAAMEAGKRCSLISDAGTPAISDPGWRLIQACHARGLSVFSIPGPSALSAALAACGQPTRRFAFEGFPPSTNKERRAFFQRLSANRDTTVLFESPHKIHETLQLLHDLCGGQRQLSICRELSKLHEENRLQSLATWLAAPPLNKGEFVLVLEGAPEQPGLDPLPAAREQAAFLRQAGLRSRDIFLFLQKFHDLSRKQAYELGVADEETRLD